MQQRKIHLEERGLIPAAAPVRRLRGLFGGRQPVKSAPALPADTRLYAIGDVHGRLDLLDTLLEAVRRDSEARAPCALVEVVLLGDLVDRGPDSAGVVRRAMHPPGWATFHTILGNHEHAMIEGLDGDRKMARLWIENGGDAALRSWGLDEGVLTAGTYDDLMAAARAAIPAAERQWLAERPVALTRGGYYFVHAGVRPGVPLDRQTTRDALWIRDAFLESEADHGPMIVHGHSIAHQVDERANRIGIDTGAYASGVLTALALEGTSRWTLQTA